jgi:hypothetical protein
MHPFFSKFQKEFMYTTDLIERLSMNNTKLSTGQYHYGENHVVTRMVFSQRC